MDIIVEDRVKAKGNGKNGTPKAPKGIVEFCTPYCVEVAVEGTEALLFHRYDIEAQSAKASAKKGSIEKKSDNVESYVYRLPDDTCAIPGLMLKAALCTSAKFSQDPRSPRKSAYDLFRAGIKIPGMSSLGKKTWDFIDQRKVNVQRNGIVRARPAFLAGWKAEFTIQVLLPEYIAPGLLNENIVRAGRICGLGDFRPDFGTFMVTKFEVLAD